jgi:N6-L-threonylcarbamoyladenine synthase
MPPPAPQILAIESSCDESALALFDGAKGISWEIVHSQIPTHKIHGGVVPELAVREHLKKFPELLAKMPSVFAHPPLRAKGAESNITQIAVTVGPGLVGSLAMGMALGKAIALQHGIPLVGVNHLRAHAFSPFISVHKNSPEKFAEKFREALPHLGLLVSGGNTLLYEIGAKKNLKLLARTKDDAAGEALDKAAKMLGLPYPGGPMIEKLASEGDPKKFEFPIPFRESPDLAFSFSGLKTALRYKLQKMSAQEVEREKANLAASFQNAVVDALVLIVRRALRRGPPGFAQTPLVKSSSVRSPAPAGSLTQGLRLGIPRGIEKPDEKFNSGAWDGNLEGSQGAAPTNMSPPEGGGKGVGSYYKSIGLCGGVSQNSLLRASMAEIAHEFGVELLLAEPKHCGDNAAMIAFAAWADAGGLREVKSFEPSLGIESDAPAL